MVRAAEALRGWEPSFRQALGAESHNSFEYLLLIRSFLRQDTCPEGIIPLTSNGSRI